MKKKTLISALALVLALFVGLFCSSCFGDLPDDSSSGSGEHKHSLTKVEAVAATCEAAGNSEYYSCSCGKIYSDAAGKTETSAEAVAIAALGHDYQAQTKIPATYYTEGTKAHYKCSRCNVLAEKNDQDEYVKTTPEALKIKKLSLIDGATQATDEPAGLLHIESGKVKNMTYGGLYTVEEKTAYYFHSETDVKKAETRFITEGTFTGDPKADRIYNYNSNVISFSFRYKLINTASERLAETIVGGTANQADVIMQILEPAYTHNYVFDADNDGEWHTFNYTLTESDQAVFAGFIIKFGKFNGELLIADIKVNTKTHTHSYGEWIPTKEATCTAKGSKKKVCSCGDEIVEEIDALGHDYKFVEEDSATYYEEGVKAHYECSRCKGLAVKNGETYTETTLEALKLKKLSLIDGATQTTEEPEGFLSIESGKVKAMTYKGLYTVDGTTAYYYTGSDAVKAETRFVTEGTYTGDGERTYNYHPEVIKFSFRYRITNTTSAELTETLTNESGKATMIMQILEPAYTHNYAFNANTDGAWHTFEYTLTDDDKSVFAGFIIKIGKFNGELLIADISVERHEHAYTEQAGKAATYYAEGVKTSYTCDCGKLFVKSGDEYVETTSEALKINRKTMLEETTASVRNAESDDFINTIVDGKLKFLDQTPETGTKFVTTADKSGNQVLAAYFSNSTAWSEAEDRVDDGNNNWGFGEFRIALSGNITKISFEYKMWDIGNGVCQVADQSDKSYGMKHVIEYSDAAGYRNESKAVYGDRFLIADGEWHTFTLEATGTGMKNVLLKMYHFTGEMLVTNYTVTVA